MDIGVTGPVKRTGTPMRRGSKTSKAHLAYSNTHNLTIAAMGFGMVLGHDLA